MGWARCTEMYLGPRPRHKTQNRVKVLLAFLLSFWASLELGSAQDGPSPRDRKRPLTQVVPGGTNLGHTGPCLPTGTLLDRQLRFAKAQTPGAAAWAGQGDTGRAQPLPARPRSLSLARAKRLQCPELHVQC